ncbi:MAG TPA: hybrid sensor histidine kinase/response regulator [Elusimicrobia bacterium]|nr:hybrid sensor histidine kinase/response regulator [Elusimicrobiota bacterium]
MAHNGEEFRKKLLITFRGEAEDHIRELGSGFLKLEDPSFSGSPAAILETVFRAAHSLKGAARAVDEKETEAVCQALESVLADLKKDNRPPGAALLDLLLAAVRTLQELAAPAKTEGTRPASIRAAETVSRLEAAMHSRPGGGRADNAHAEKPLTGAREIPGDEPHPVPTAAENVRVPLAVLESLLRQTEELLACKLAAAQRCVDLKDLTIDIGLRRKEWAAARPGTGTDIMETPRNYLAGLEKAENGLRKGMEQDQRALASQIDRLHWEMKRTMMLPFSTLLEGFPLFLREMLRSQGKDADLVMEGTELAVDRRILQEMKDPLLHLARNAVDHGIEKRETRLGKNKPPRGRIFISISKKEGNKAEIIIKDDGAGIDAGKVAAAAARLGIPDTEAAGKADMARAGALIFKSGVSTCPIITDISGRGLGLAIVREKVERLGGTVEVETAPGETVFRIVLPLTVSTLRGILVESGGETFAVPISQVERAGRAGPEETRTVEGKAVVSSGGRTIPLLKLCETLGLAGVPRPEGNAGCGQFIVAVSGEERAAFQVDQVLMEQELLVKGLGGPLANVRGVSGAAVLGGGKVVPMLNMRDLIEAGGKPGVPAPRGAGAPGGQKRKKAVLIAEDSITARTLLKNIFEAAGYEVKTAVDGEAAFELLRSVACDIVVSDVDMPKMTGFELTARIRADKNLSDLPVVLVTALESDRDRERGIDAGANAYIVKSKFEQNDILEIIERLI